MSASRTARQVDSLIAVKTDALRREFKVDPLMMPWLRQILTELAYKSIDIAIENEIEGDNGASFWDSPLKQLRRNLAQEGTHALARARNSR